MPVGLLGTGACGVAVGEPDEVAVGAEDDDADDDADTEGDSDGISLAVGDGDSPRSDDDADDEDDNDDGRGGAKEAGEDDDDARSSCACAAWTKTAEASASISIMRRQRSNATRASARCVTRARELRGCASTQPALLANQHDWDYATGYLPLGESLTHSRTRQRARERESQSAPPRCTCVMRATASEETTTRGISRSLRRISYSSTLCSYRAQNRSLCCGVPQGVCARGGAFERRRSSRSPSSGALDSRARRSRSHDRA